MEISFVPKQYAEDLTCEGLVGIPQEYLRSLLKELIEVDPTLELGEVNYGRGADWIWLIVTLYVGTDFIKLGETLSNGIDGWIKIGQRLKNLSKKAKEIVYDMDGITLLSMVEIYKRNPHFKSIKKVIQYQFENEYQTDFGILSQRNYYIVGFEIDGTELNVFGSDQSGKLELLKSTRIS